jgi:hypothetical protein
MDSVAALLRWVGHAPRRFNRWLAPAAIGSAVEAGKDVNAAAVVGALGEIERGPQKREHGETEGEGTG